MTTSRRDFLKSTAMGNTLISMGFLDACISHLYKIDELGLITGVIRDEINDIPENILRNKV